MQGVEIELDKSNTGAYGIEMGLSSGQVTRELRYIASAKILVKPEDIGYSILDTKGNKLCAPEETINSLLEHEVIKEIYGEIAQTLLDKIESAEPESEIDRHLRDIADILKKKTLRILNKQEED